MALMILTASQINPVNFSFPTLFADPAVDMLCPFDMNKYLEISDEDPENASVPPVPIALSLSLPYPNIMYTDVNDKTDELMFEKVLVTQANVDVPSTQLHQVHPDPSIPSSERPRSTSQRPLVVQKPLDPQTNYLPPCHQQRFYI
jgi:hypothetical protein